MAPASTTDLILFAVTSAAAIFMKKKMDASCEDVTVASAAGLKNSAFVFVKPHANTAATQALVQEKLISSGLTILSESDISGPVIDSKKLIDQHYYAIASKATILPASEIPVPPEKFESTFDEKWDEVLAAGKACNAMEACEKFGCTADELNAAWGDAKVSKFGGGFYCGLVTLNGKSLYVFNAFFMSMRSKFVGTDDSIHCYEVEWDPSVLSWSSFRNELLGPTDPAAAPAGSIRKTILEKWEELGLSAEPNKGDNGVHASASPFEGLAEKNNWLERDIAADPFGAALLAKGLSLETIKEWSVDPRVELPGGEGKGSVFDALEDMDVDECAAKLAELNEINAGIL
mmetsp:Transcript_9954/g.12934  ORF Transcript_9954/g.12934 Transcript_9954/m.12934 type:complete len:346 (+) Transcript_9954:123-1160(+)|eukprot:CAMPEP_0116068640 /NCGR_PEP_ID=MMETSP0322-20121206/11789_1 /TAXON_ID=163516 /ORGANISM="Leptocylindrus danicus var. apora, Strain B651" /LENGTH=345 /DNA_ID=CAMNT_0003555805 /DNA_START=59 /DNA_END=1096 /DNA_ORIENTATION=+